MRTLIRGASVLCSALGAMTAIGSTSFAADTHTVVGTQNVTWTYNGKASKTDGTPLVVDDLKIADIIEIQIPAGPIPHGFVTTKKAANGVPAEAKDLVLACGEDKSSKPNAVLRETGCGANSQFGVVFKGSMQLEVLDTFKDPVDFWCIIHTKRMSGTLKLKQ